MHPVPCQHLKLFLVKHVWSSRALKSPIPGLSPLYVRPQLNSFSSHLLFDIIFLFIKINQVLKVFIQNLKFICFNENKTCIHFIYLLHKYKNNVFTFHLPVITI